MAADRVGVIVAGGGARGAYEAGVLSVVLPPLERSGPSPHVCRGQRQAPSTPPSSPPAPTYPWRIRSPRS